VGDERDLGYIRFRHGLEDARLVEQLDAALRDLRDTRTLMLDLRDASGDGHRDVTRAILARFAASEAPWQLRETSRGQRIADRVAPRTDAYRAPLIVLVDRWTAGEGEALAAGLVAVANARLVGTPMAGLRGELAEVKLPRSGFVVRYPAQRVFHVDGTPREALKPHVPVDLAAPQGGPGDPILYQALKLAAGSPSPAPAGRSGSR
jgi:carboxyl-terminal processing protease